MTETMIRPAPAPPAGVNLADVSAAVARARQVLLDQRRPDGSWVAYCDFGPAATAQVLVGLRFIDRLDPADAEAARRWLVSRQREDGSFVSHPFARSGDLGATACAWAGFHAAGLGPDEAPVRRAREYVLAHGGVPALATRIDQGDLAGLFLAMMGLVSPRDLPEPNLAFALARPVVRLLERRFNVLMPITLLQVGLLLRHLRGEPIGGATPGGFLAGIQAQRCLELLDAYHNNDGSWLYGDTFHAAMCLGTFKAIGLDPRDQRYARGVNFLAGQARREPDGLWYSIFNTDVWPTAFALRALIASGTSRASDEAARATRWLAGAKVPGRDGRGGVTWSFQSGNQTMPDCDDVGVVLAPFGMALDASHPDRLPDAVAGEVRPCLEDAITWLMSMQNPDGGWPAFQHGLPGKQPGPMMMGPPPPPPNGLFGKLRFLLSPPAELGDPSTEDVTGRVLHGLGQIGYTGAAPEVQRALTFLRAQQLPDGSFWGRWVVNYLAGTAWVLRGLAAIGASTQESWIRKSVKFLLDHQNADGGWGEDVASYADPRLSGRGTSTPGLTGLVVSALIEVDPAQGGKAIEAGIQYLLQAQRPDGSWPNENLLHALVPPSLFYTLPGTELQLPLEALGVYLSSRAGRLDPALPDSESDATRRRAFQPEAALRPVVVRDVRGNWHEPALEPLVFEGDPLADAVIRELFAGGQTDAVNGLLRTLARTADPVPANLPPLTHAFFRDTAILPAWVNRDRIRKAQELFERCGWGVGAVLFCSSLPQCYAFPEGARVLLYTQGTSRHAWRRIIETAQLVFDVASEGGLDAQGAGLRSSQKVRLMHGAIRHLVEQQTSWNTAWGVPINQVQLAGTLLSFSCLVVTGLRRLGFEVSDEEAEAWVHLWNVVGHVLGIREELRPRGMADGEALFAVLRTHWRASAEGQELTRATLDLMRELLPEEEIDGLPAALVRHLAGDQCADLLGVPRADWTALLVKAATRLTEVFERTGRHLDVLGLAQHVSFDLMKALHGWAREGKNVGFRIPDALIRQWDGDRSR
jgi:squalene cyclase